MRNYFLKKIYLFANRFDGVRARSVRLWCLEHMTRAGG